MLTAGDRRYLIRILSVIALVFCALALGEFVVDFSGAVTKGPSGEAHPVRWSDLTVSAPMFRALASPCCRAINNLVALILTFIALAIPITANMYTPRLIQLFVMDRVNMAALAISGILGAHSIFAASMSFDAFLSPLALATLAVGAIGLWILLIPYYFYVLRFLDPTTIIILVTREITNEMRSIVARRRPVAEAQERLDAAITHLGSVILRAVDRGDRDVAIAAIRALHGVMAEYGRLKPQIDRAFFKVTEDLFSGMPSAAIDLVSQEEVWVERKLLNQLSLAYTSALTRMPDAVGAICDALKDTAVALSEAKAARPTLALVVRFQNTLLREGIKRKDVHALYDSLYHYKSLARKLMKDHPDIATEMADHLRYYAEYAIESGMPFAYELVSYELADVAEWGFENGLAPARAYHERLLEMDGATTRVRLVKSRLILASYFKRKGLDVELTRTVASLDGVPAGLLERARDGILRARERAFREVTERQLDFDFVDDARKQSVREIVGGILSRSQGAPA